MKALLWREGTGSNYSRGQRALFGELDPVTACFQQLVGKRYPLKAVRTLEKKGGGGGSSRRREEKGNDSLIQTEPTQEHTALSGTDSILCARCKSILWEAPEKGGVSTRGETLAKELNLERSDFVLDRQPDAFRSGRAHQLLSVDLIYISCGLWIIVRNNESFLFSLSLSLSLIYVGLKMCLYELDNDNNYDDDDDLQPVPTC